MRTRITGAAIVAATTLLAFHPSPMQKEEIKPTISLQKDEVPVSTSPKGAALVLSTGQVPVTLVNTIDGDTIKVRVQGRIET